MILRPQLRFCRASQNQLELDLKNKENALGIDTVCHQLNNQSYGLQYYSGIEKYDPWYLSMIKNICEYFLYTILYNCYVVASRSKKLGRTR